MISLDEVLVVSVGRPVPWKGFGALGRAVAELLAAGRKVRLVVIGVTDAELRAMMARANAPPRPPGDTRIAGIGVVDTARVLAWLCAADCFVLNTAYEGLSHVILEAMYAGTPVITTNVGGNRELIRHGETGIIVPYNDGEKLKQAIAALADNRGVYAPLAAHATHVVQRFSTAAMVQATENLLVAL